MFLTDQQRWDTTGLHGNPLGLTPNYDRLAMAGTHLRHSFTCQPLCVPARACLQTGRYPTTVGCTSNQCPLPAGTRTLAHEFADAGYRTAYFGKWHLAPERFRGAVPEPYRGGYQDWMAANLLELVSDSYDCRLWDGAGAEHRLPGYRADAVTDAAIAYLRRPRGEPVFLFLSLLEPHHQNSRDDFPAPADDPQSYDGHWLPADLAGLDPARRQQLAGYCGMVRRIDECLGRLVGSLAETGMAENTILLFTSDHGCHFKTRNREYKRSCHESSIRVPTFFHGPGFAGGGDRAEFVSLIDLPPTLLEAAGLPVPAAMQGRSVWPSLRGEPGWRDEILVQISEAQDARALRTPRWKYCVSAMEPGAVYGDSELYDLAADPAEQRNLIGEPEYRGVAEGLRARLRARMMEAGDAAGVLAPGHSQSNPALSTRARS